MGLIAFALLGGALLVFLLSTSQYRLSYRSVIWGMGVALLLGAAWAESDWREQSLLLKIIADVAHGDASWISRLSREWIAVGDASVPIFGLSWIFAAALGLLALTAFTPGEALEKTIRPFKFGLIGAIGGALVALAAVAIGLAGYNKHRGYAANWDKVEVHDGDTIIFGDVAIRLIGVDAPELDQTCIAANGGAPIDCGAQAKRHLDEIIRGNVVVCESRLPDKNGNPPRESFGRPLLQCFSKARGRPDRDLSYAMIADGYAFAYEKAPKVYQMADAQTKSEHRGLLKTSCVVEPDAYRTRSKVDDGERRFGACP